jgi:hypothetical protein
MNGNSVLSTRSGPAQLLLAANSTRTGTAVVQPADQTATPATVTTAGAEAAVVPFADGGSYSANGLLIMPFGTDTAAQSFLMAVFGWELIRGDQANVLDSWHAQLLAAFTCTLSTTAVGLANTQVNASQFYCDTITVLKGNSNVSCEAVSPTTNVAACVRVDVEGAQYADVRFWRNGSAASANGLQRRV